MKNNLLCLPAGLLLTALFLQGCNANSKLLDSHQQVVTHEHRVHLPAAMYAPGSSNTPFFEKQGELQLAVDYTQSGKNTNDDSNNGGSQSHVVDGISHQTSTRAQTYTARGGYALTDRIGIIGNLTLGSKHEDYTPYIESWNIQQSTYSSEYWAWLPVPWDVWNGVSWNQTDHIETINDYDKITKNIHRSYRYLDAELGAGRFSRHDNWKTEVYGGLGFAQNKYEGHLDRKEARAAYGRHSSNFYKIFAQPAIAYSSGWFEAGAALKGSFVHYDLKETAAAGGQNLPGEHGNQFFIEPSLLLRIGPRACRLSIEQKWLTILGKSRFPVNSSFLSVGIISILNTDPGKG